MQRLADRLVLTVAEDTLGRRIPADDPALRNLADDGNVRTLHDRGQPGMLALDFMALALADVEK